ncbi:hypothetical protein A8V49_12635 [Yersinia pestis]|nr:hypothetical protein AU082_08175 [Yersinia pestis]PCN66585.1 hypothetical protein A8V49_12635 [Yersinia pestis]
MSLYRISSLHQAKQLNKNKQLNKTRISKSVVWANIVIQAIFPLSIAFTPAVMAAETVGASDENRVRPHRLNSLPPMQQHGWHQY